MNQALRFFLLGPVVRRAPFGLAEDLLAKLIRLGLAHRVGPYLRLTLDGLSCR